MVERWEGIARRRSAVVLVVGLCALAAVFAVARTAPQALPVGSLAPQGEPSDAAFVSVLVSTPAGVEEPVRDVALDAITAQLETDPNVAGVQVVRRDEDELLLHALPDDGGANAVRDTIARLQANLDPGPLGFVLGGRMATVETAKAELGGGLWRAELPALAAVALILLFALGMSGALTAMAVGAFALLGTLAALRGAGLLIDVYLLGVAAAAPVALALSVEFAAALFARHRSARALGAGRDSGRLALAGFAQSATLAVAAAVVAPLAILALPLQQRTSLAVGCALAAALAFAGLLLLGPMALAGGERGRMHMSLRERLPRRRPRLPARLRERLPLERLGARLLPRERSPQRRLRLRLSARPALGPRARAIALVGLALAALLLAAPALAVRSHALAEEAGSLAADLPLAGALALVLACALPAAALRAPRALALAPLTVLPAAAALGVGTALAAGWLPIDPFGGPLDTLENGALACALCAVLAVSAARTARICAIAAEAQPAPPAAVRAVLRAEASRPAALATGLTMLASLALLAVEPYAARQFGAMVAAGLLVDTLVSRPLTVALAPRLLGRRDAPRRPLPVASPVQ